MNAARFLVEHAWSRCAGQSESWVTTADGEGARIQSEPYDHESPTSRSRNAYGMTWGCSRSTAVRSAPAWVPPPPLVPVHHPDRFVGAVKLGVGWKP